MAQKKMVDRARLHVHATYNNTIITLTDLDGNVLGWSSPGVVGFKGSRKGTPYAAQLATERIMEKMKEFGIKSVVVTVDGTGSGRNSVVNALKNSPFRVEEVKNITPVSHS
jgi:small subunit ribosomal protein S11